MYYMKTEMIIKLIEADYIFINTITIKYYNLNFCKIIDQW